MAVVKVGPASVRVTYSQAVPVNMRGKVRELSSLVVDSAQRGHGFARALMDKLMTDADKCGYALLVIVKAFDDSPLDEARLAAWYARLGFAEIQREPMVMVRAPAVMH